MLLVHREAEGKTVIVDQKETLAFLDLRVNQENLETRG